MNKKLLSLLLLALLASPALATTDPRNECGNRGNNCEGEPAPNYDNDASSDADADADADAYSDADSRSDADADAYSGSQSGAQSGSISGANAEGGKGIGIGEGGDAAALSGSASNAEGGNAASLSHANGGDAAVKDSGNSASLSGAISGSASGVNDSGNSASLSSATGGRGGESASLSSARTGDSVSLSGASADSKQLTSVDASSDGSGNSSTYVDAADRSTTHYEAQALFLPTIQNAAPALVASPAITTERSECGPRVKKITNGVQGTYVGMFVKSFIELGVDDELVQADEPYRYWTDKYGVEHVLGHQLLTTITVNGVASSRSLTLGGGVTGGDWGQAGGSSGSSMQRTIVRVQVRECELPLAPRQVNVEVDG
jgi:hypothetical protein